MENKKTAKNSIGREIFEWVYTIVIAVVIAFAIKAFLFDIVKVDGSSMHPTLVDKERLIVTKLGYDPEAGDIVILDSTYKNREAYYDKLATDGTADGKTDIRDIIFLKKNLSTLVDSVFLSEEGDDRNSGSEDKPVRSLNKAIDMLKHGGTVNIIGKYKLNSY